MILLLACATEPEEVARRLLPEGEPGIVQIGVGERRLRRVVGSTAWDGFDVGEALAGCALAPGSTVEAELRVALDDFPWTVAVDGAGEAEACVREALSRLPFEEPLGAEAEDLVLLRVIAGRAPSPEPIVELGGERLNLAPPAWYGSMRAGRMPGVELDPLRWRPAGRVERGHWAAAEEAARRLRCEGAPELVRLWVHLRRGEVEAVDTSPETPCVEARVEELRSLEVRGRPAADWEELVLVLDLPGGAW